LREREREKERERERERACRMKREIWIYRDQIPQGFFLSALLPGTTFFVFFFFFLFFFEYSSFFPFSLPSGAGVVIIVRSVTFLVLVQMLDLLFFYGNLVTSTNFGSE
jgi:hypothetical protein